MLKEQILKKINELESWLEHNHNHPDRITIENDIRDLKNQLLKDTNHV